MDTTANGALRIQFTGAEEKKALRMFGGGWKAKFIEFMSYYSSHTFSQMRQQALTMKLAEKSEAAIDSVAAGEK